jgi:hypothetical protein
VIWRWLPSKMTTAFGEPAALRCRGGVEGVQRPAPCLLRAGLLGRLLVNREITSLAGRARRHAHSVSTLVSPCIG